MLITFEKKMRLIFWAWFEQEFVGTPSDQGFQQIINRLNESTLELEFLKLQI